jgi:hypothetical protein
MPIQSSQFQVIKCGDETNTLQDISAKVRTANKPRAYNPKNATTFVAGGGAVTNRQERGAVQSQPQVEVYHDNDIVDLLVRILGSRSGSTWQFLEGNNATPAAGDMMFQGTFTLFGMNLNYQSGQEAVWVLDLKPTVGGLIVPDWYPA